MSNTGNWDSFFEDEDQKKNIEDDWGSINNSDFEDVSATEPILDKDFDDIEINVGNDNIIDNEPDNTDDYKIEDDFDDVFDKKTEETKEDRFKLDDTDNKSKSPLMIVLIAILAVGLITAAIIFIVKGSSCGKTSFRENAPSEVLELVNKYYTARIQQDTYTLKEVLDSKITIDEAELKSEASILEGYQDIKIYTTSGVNSGDYVVYVSFNVKFKNIETPAPGFAPAYAKVDENGNIKFIPNEYLSLYGQDIQKCIAEAGESDTIKALVDDINKKYEEALNSDAALKEYVEKKFGSADSTSSETTAAETTTAAEATTAADTGELKAEDPSTFTTCDEIWYANDDVRLREQPNTDASTGFTQLTKGTKLWVTAKGKQWAKAMDESTGKEGYVATRYLSMNKPD